MSDFTKTGTQLQVQDRSFKLKKDSTAGITCEFCAVFQNNYSTEHLWTTNCFYEPVSIYNKIIFGISPLIEVL